MSYDTILFNV